MSRRRDRAISRLITFALMLQGVFFAATIGAPDESNTSIGRIENRSVELRRQWSLGSYRTAIDLLREASISWQDRENFADAARCLREAAEIELVLSDYKSAIETTTTALRMDERIGSSDGAATDLSLLSLIYLRSGEVKLSRLAFEQALRLSEKSESPTVRADALHSAAQHTYSYGNAAEAKELFAESLRNALHAGDRELVAKSQLYLGFTHIKLGEPTVSLDYVRNALNEWHELNDKRGQGICYVGLGFVYTILSQKQEALNSYKHAETLFPPDFEWMEKGKLYNGFATIYEEFGQLPLAEQYSRKALMSYQRSGYLYGQLATLPTLANLVNLNGNAELSEALYREGIQLAHKLNDKHHLAYIRKDLSEIYLTTKKYDDAITSLLEAKRVFEELSTELPAVEQMLAEAYFRKGEFETARMHFERSLEISKKTREFAIESFALFRLAILDNQQNKFDDALIKIKKSLEVNDRLYSNIANSNLKRTLLSSVFDRYSLLANLLMKKHSLSSDTVFAKKALQASESARSRTFLETLRLSEADFTADADPSIVQREKDILDSMNSRSDSLTDLLSVGNPDKLEVEKLEGEINELQHEIEEIRAELKQKSPVYSAIKDPPPFDVEGFQQNVLDEDSVLLEFFLGKEESYLWVVDKREVVAFVLPPRDEIEKRVEGLRSLLTARQPKSGESIDEREERVAAAEQEYWPAARELSNLLLGGPADKLRNKRLIVVPDGKLHYLPFSALPLPNSESDEPMLLTNEYVYQPSAQTLALLTQLGTKRSAVERRDLLIYSDPVFSADDERLSGLDVSPASADEAKLDTFRFVESLGSLPRLPGSKTETAAVIESSGTKAADSFSGFAANRERLLNTDLSAYKVLHFATHGIVFDDRPELSGIVLSRFGEQGQQMNEFIRLQDIYGMKLNADLVVLSACDTGVGKEVKGEGIMSLNTAFLQSGARSVLASLWKVEDGAAQKLMKEFYSGISIENLTPSESLRRAQISLAKDPRYASPFYWAAFTLQGDPNVRPAIGRRSISLWALTAFPIWFAAAYFAWRRRVK